MSRKSNITGKSDSSLPTPVLWENQQKMQDSAEYGLFLLSGIYVYKYDSAEYNESILSGMFVFKCDSAEYNK